MVTLVVNKNTSFEVQDELTIEHTFDAPRLQVWKAWTEPERLRYWWGPKGYSMRVGKMDFRPDGVFHYSLVSEDGETMWGKFCYEVIEAPERMVFFSSFSDKESNLTRNPMSQTWPLELVNLLVLTEQNGKTKLSLRGGPHAAKEVELKTYRESHEAIRAGFQGTFERLERYLKSENHFMAVPGINMAVMTRVFDAPRQTVYKLYTDPRLIPQWWGPARYTTIVDKMELRPGGIWRYIQKDKAGKEYAFHGVYHDISAPERIVSTFEYEDMPGHISLGTVTFEERDGKTILTDTSIFQSIEDRDGMIHTGMEEGLAESLDRFARLLKR